MAAWRERIRRLMSPLENLGWGGECIAWLLMAAVILWPRWVLVHALPVPLWSNDSASYVMPAIRFLDGESWISNERRGPVYSMFLAGCIGAGGGLWSMVLVQQALAGACVLASAAVVRLWCGRAVLVPLTLATFGYGLYNLPVYVAHLVRVETLLLALLTAALGLLAVALKTGSRGWAFGAGLATGVAAVTKGLLGPYPILAALVLGWVQRRSWRAAAVAIALFAAGFLAPKLLFHGLTRADVGDFSSESYSGIQFYGRVAQWTRLEGGILPELKAFIRPQVEEYRAKEKRDNNLVIKRLIVPRIEVFLREHPAEVRSVDRVCRELAFEAVAASPGGFAGQAWHDLRQLLFRTAFKKQMPSRGDLQELADDVERIEGPLDRVMPRSTGRTLRAAASGDALEPFWRIGRWAWLFETYPPVLLTSLLLPVVWFLSRGPQRAWVLAIAGFWYFNLLLFSTVGKPLNRYFSPFSPVMFWAPALLLGQLWLLLLRRSSAGAREAAPAPKV